VFKRLFVIALLTAIPSFFAAPAAKADNVVTNQWYTAQFGSTVPSAVSGGTLFGDATDGPVLPGGFANSIDAPAGTSWTITLAGNGTFTVTDLEDSGDQFQVWDNGVPMTGTWSPFNAPGQNPGWTSPGGGWTSVPCNNCVNLGDDINVVLGSPDFSSATFLLGTGVNVININYEGVIGNGDVAFIAEATPEPNSLALFGTGLVGILFAFRRKLTA
jgi:hypothetical protein